MSRYWILELRVAGRLYRYAERELSITTAAGDTVVARPGLAPLELTLGEDPSVDLVDCEIDWLIDHEHLLGADARLLRWTEGQVLERAETVHQGQVLGSQADSSGVSLDLGALSGSPTALGTQLPDVLAKVDASTFSSPAGGEGAYYPIILGYPGYHTAGSNPEAVVPIPLGLWSATDSAARAVVAEDGVLQAATTQVYTRNDTQDTEGLQDVVAYTDLLGRVVRACHFSLSSAVKPASATSTDRLLAGYSPALGIHPVRSVWSALEYLLQRWGGAVDWPRLRDVEEYLSGIAIDTWIDAPVSDPWAWAEGTVAGDLGLELRYSARGPYYYRRLYVADRLRAVGSLSVDRGEATRASAVARDGAPANEWSADYQRLPSGDWRSRVVLSAAPEALVPGVDAPTASGSQLVVRSGRAARSHALYGRIQAGPRTIDWTWDTGTVVRVLELEAERAALPASLVTYLVPGGEDLVDGDVVLLTDAQLGWSARPALVDSRTVGGPLPAVALRVPVEV